MKRYVLGITGTTGVVLGLRVLEVLSKVSEVHLVVSKVAGPIIKDETGKPIEDFISNTQGKVVLYREDDLWAPISSGSFKVEAMAVVPCSMKTLSAIANGYASGLIERAADVCLKEGRKLVLCPRETPFSAIHLENMLKLARLGVRIVPPVIGFYHKPETLQDMIDFVSGKVIEQMGLEHNLYKPWGSGVK